MLSSLFAGLAGVLLAPLFDQLAVSNFTVLLVAAIAAAAFARLTSIPLALLGGLLLGILQGILAGYLPLNSVLATGLRPSLPFVVLFLLLLFWPGLRQKREVNRPALRRRPPAARPRRGAARPRAHHRHPRARCRRRAGRSRCGAVRPGRVLAADRDGGRRVLRHLPVDHRHHRHGGPDLVVPGVLRRRRRLHHRAARPQLGISPCCSRWPSAP